MKNKTIKSINTLGKVTNIFILIMEAILGVGFVLILAGVVVMAAMPDDIVTGTIDAQAQILIQDVNDIDIMGIHIPVKVGLESETEITELVPGVTATGYRIDDGNAVINIDGSSETLYLSDIFKPFILEMVIFCVGIVFLFVVLVFAQRVANALKKCETPFEENVVKKLRALSFSMIPMAVFSCLEVSWGSVGFRLNLTMFLAVAVILVVNYIFQFGAQLQQESDETL